MDLLMIILFLMFGSPVMADGHFEMFQEICAITGEVKQTVVYEYEAPQLSVVEPLDLEEN